MSLSQWFNMWSTENPNERNEMQNSSLKNSVAEMLHAIRHKATIVSQGKIFLAEICQEFATALASFFADGQGLDGLIRFRSWMLLLAGLDLDATGQAVSEMAMRMHAAYFGTHPERVSPSQLFGTDVFLAHANDDDVVSYQHGAALNGSLTQLGYNVDWHLYQDGGHWVNELQGVCDVGNFLQPRMG